MHNSTTTTTATASPAPRKEQGTYNNAPKEFAGTQIKGNPMDKGIPAQGNRQTQSVRDAMEDSGRVMRDDGGNWIDCETGDVLSFEQARAVYLGNEEGAE